MLRALIWKDVRVNRLPLLLAAALIVASYAAMAILGSWDPTFSAQPWDRRIFGVLLTGSLASHVGAQLALAVLSGNLFAAERVDRSAEFLVYLPPSRGMVMGAKAALLAATALVLLVIPASITGLAALIGQPPAAESLRSSASIAASISAVGFCARESAGSRPVFCRATPSRSSAPFSPLGF